MSEVIKDFSETILLVGDKVMHIDAGHIGTVIGFKTGFNRHKHTVDKVVVRKVFSDRNSNIEPHNLVKIFNQNYYE